LPSGRKEKTVKRVQKLKMGLTDFFTAPVRVWRLMILVFAIELAGLGLILSTW
jgi:hypothetical protein